MKFKPRYSLLSLLVLMAFIASGVKWWYGPHHTASVFSNLVRDPS